ncbi:hypothetical protein JNB62_15480 [Microbacterium jejuense]|uniref:DUF2127 domain-containing protein n=2 Tax=Microbacterium jejuense TaxID=1263637 RepID=A0ABS7HQ41_9MICO|nr:hypothetical protein [Microbacterium jejuense]
MPQPGDHPGPGATPHHPHKRPAFEPAERLLRRPEHDPGMRRPASTVAGAVLVLLRAAAGLLVIAGLAVQWPAILADPDVDLALDGVSEAEAGQWALWVIVAVGGLIVVLDIAFAAFVLRGSNVARVAVMLISTVSISTTFVGWWAQGQEIHVDETFVSLALDILVLLALSSRSAAAYARRNEQR